MARLLRRSSPEAGRPPAPHRTPVVSPGAAFGEYDCFEHDSRSRTSAVLHSPSSWQAAQKLQRLSPSKRSSVAHLRADSPASATAHALYAESSRTVRAAIPSDLPATPNAAVRMQRAAAQTRAPSLPTPTSSRPSTAAGSSLPPRSISGRSVSSVEFFAASEATATQQRQQQQRRSGASSSSGLQDLERDEHQVSRSSMAGKQRSSIAGIAGPKATPAVSNDPVVQCAATVADSLHGGDAQRSGALSALQQELGRLHAHRVTELHRLKSAMQRPSANLLMRERNLPEAEPCDKGQLQLSLRNRWHCCTLLQLMFAAAVPLSLLVALRQLCTSNPS